MSYDDNRWGPRRTLSRPRIPKVVSLQSPDGRRFVPPAEAYADYLESSRWARNGEPESFSSSNCVGPSPPTVHRGRT
eukprot:1318047-Alexandrium_andersonii.AAC.1